MMQADGGRPASRQDSTGRNGAKADSHGAEAGLVDSAALQEKAAATFKAFDKENRNSLDHEGMMAALTELGVLNGITAKKLNDILSFGADGHAQKRSYNAAEFISFFERLASYQAKQARSERIKAHSRMPEVPEGSEQDEIMQKVFLNYCKYTVGQGRSTYDENDPKMSSTQFVKLCQDLGLVQPNGPLNVVTVDVIFHKCKPTGGRRFGVKEFLQALVAAAEDSKINVFERVAVLGGQLKPNKTFVAPQAVVFRQETRAYTPLTVPAAGLDGTVPRAPFTGEEGSQGLGDYAAGGMRDRSYQKRSGQMGGEDGDDHAAEAAPKIPPKPPGGARGNSLDDLAARLEACEKADIDLQVAVKGINHVVSKEVARGLKETASAVVKESVSSQLGAMVKKMLVEGDMTTQIQASITQSMATMISGVMERLKGLESREEALNKRLAAAEAKGGLSVAAAPGKAAPAKKMTPEETAKAAAQKQADEIAISKVNPATGLSRLEQIEEQQAKVTQSLAFTQGLRADFDSRTSALEKTVKALQAEAEDLKSNNRKLTFQLENMTATAAEAAAAAAAAAASAATSGPDSPFFQFNQKQLFFEQKLNQLQMSIAKSSAENAAIAPADALDALEAAVNNNLDLLHKTLNDKIIELQEARKAVESKVDTLQLNDTSKMLEKFVTSLEQKVAATNSQIKVVQEEAKAKSVELERRITAADRAQQEFTHMVKSLKIGQEARGVATEKKEPEGAGASSAVAEDLIKQMKTVLQDMNTFKADYQSAMMLIKGDFVHLEARVNAVENDKDPSRLSSYAPIVEVRELENHIMARVSLQGDEMTALARTVNDVIQDVTTINNKLTENTWQTRVTSAGGGMTPDVLKDIEKQLQAHLNTVYQDMLAQLEARWATSDALKSSQDQSRANDEAILMAVKELDKRFYEKVDLQNEALLKMAKQVDQLQQFVKDNDRPAGNSYGVPMSANPMMMGGYRGLSSNMSMAGRDLMNMATNLQSVSGPMMPSNPLPYLPEDPNEAQQGAPVPNNAPQFAPPAFQMNLSAVPMGPGSAGSHHSMHSPGSAGSRAVPGSGGQGPPNQ